MVIIIISFKNKLNNLYYEVCTVLCAQHNDNNSNKIKKISHLNKL